MAMRALLALARLALRAESPLLFDWAPDILEVDLEQCLPGDSSGLPAAHKETTFRLFLGHSRNGRRVMSTEEG